MFQFSFSGANSILKSNDFFFKKKKIFFFKVPWVGHTHQLFLLKFLGQFEIKLRLLHFFLILTATAAYPRNWETIYSLKSKYQTRIKLK